MWKEWGEHFVVGEDESDVMENSRILPQVER